MGIHPPWLVHVYLSSRLPYANQAGWRSRWGRCWVRLLPGIRSPQAPGLIGRMTPKASQVPCCVSFVPPCLSHHGCSSFSPSVGWQARDARSHADKKPWCPPSQFPAEGKHLGANVQVSVLLRAWAGHLWWLRHSVEHSGSCEREQQGGTARTGIMVNVGVCLRGGGALHGVWRVHTELYMTLPRCVVGALGHPSYALTRNMDSYSGSFEKHTLWHFLIWGSPINSVQNCYSL